MFLRLTHGGILVSAISARVLVHFLKRPFHDAYTTSPVFIRVCPIAYHHLIDSGDDGLIGVRLSATLRDLFNLLPYVSSGRRKPTTDGAERIYLPKDGEG